MGLRIHRSIIESSHRLANGDRKMKVRGWRVSDVAGFLILFLMASLAALQAGGTAPVSDSGAISFIGCEFDELESLGISNNIPQIRKGTSVVTWVPPR